MSHRRPSVLTDIATLRNLSSGSGVSSMTALKPEDDDNEFLDLDEITLPTYRSLSEEELTLLQDILRGTLTLHNCSCALQAQEDAVDLINYACELLIGNEEDDKMTVSAVLEELEYMELEICGHDSLEQMRKGLVKFLLKLYDRDRKAGLTMGMNSMNSRKNKGGSSAVIHLLMKNLPLRRTSPRIQVQDVPPYNLKCARVKIT